MKSKYTLMNFRLPFPHSKDEVLMMVIVKLLLKVLNFAIMSFPFLSPNKRRNVLLTSISHPLCLLHSLFVSQSTRTFVVSSSSSALSNHEIVYVPSNQLQLANPVTMGPFVHCLFWALPTKARILGLDSS